MPAFTVSADIHAPRERVWRALTHPDEVVRWSDVSLALDAPDDYPQPGQHVRWIMSSGLPRWLPSARTSDGHTILHDRPLQVAPQRLLRAEISFGPIVLDETYRIEPQAGMTRVTADVQVRVRVPLAGPLIERVYALGAVRTSMQASLRTLKEYCEAFPPA